MCTLKVLRWLISGVLAECPGVRFVQAPPCWPAVRLLRRVPDRYWMTGLVLVQTLAETKAEAF